MSVLDDFHFNALNAIAKMDDATETLRRSQAAYEADRRRRDNETILDLLDSYGRDELKRMIDCVWEDSREPDDRYLDDPRRGQAELINREGI